MPREQDREQDKRIHAFLDLARKQGCSDVHFAVGAPPMLRMLGDMMPIKYRNLDNDEIDTLVNQILSDQQRQQLATGYDLDCSYFHPKVGRFRVNIFKKLGGTGATFRYIPEQIPSLKELKLPAIVTSILQYNHGLVLVTGTTGTGKTTTLAAMVNTINETSRCNIITLEDPIEFVHKSNKSLIIQREVGTHVPSFHAGLYAALREDPDVILVGELRDPETMDMAMAAAETGHLVLTTLHTSSATKTLDRIIDMVPSGRKALATTFLAQHLRCVISQRLVRSADGKSRRVIVETLINTPAIANLISKGKIFQIPAQILTGREHGMQTLDQALLEAVQKKQIDPDDAYINAENQNQFQRFVTNPDLLPQMSLVGN